MSQRIEKLRLLSLDSHSFGILREQAEFLLFICSFPVYVQEKRPPVPLKQHRQHADITRIPEKRFASSAATALLLKSIYTRLFIANPPFYNSF